MKQFFLISERIVRGIALCVVVFFLILVPIWGFSIEGYSVLPDYFEDIFDKTYNFVPAIFRISFSYILIASIYRYARFRKYVWDDLHKIFSDK
jgi:TM2 domain-containing membrane protein YozV